jgi:hypothetical protein
MSRNRSQPVPDGINPAMAIQFLKVRGMVESCGLGSSVVDVCALWYAALAKEASSWFPDTFDAHDALYRERCLYDHHPDEVLRCELAIRKLHKQFLANRYRRVLAQPGITLALERNGPSYGTMVIDDLTDGQAAFALKQTFTDQELEAVKRQMVSLGIYSEMHLTDDAFLRELLCEYLEYGEWWHTRWRRGRARPGEAKVKPSPKELARRLRAALTNRIAGGAGVVIPVAMLSPLQVAEIAARGAGIKKVLASHIEAAKKTRQRVKDEAARLMGGKGTKLEVACPFGPSFAKQPGAQPELSHA